MFPTMIILSMLGSLLLGLVLLAVGVILLLTLRNKLPGVLVMASGSLLTLAPIAIYLFLTISGSVRS